VTAPAQRTTVVPSPPDPVELAQRVAAAVAAHPAVAGLHGGIYGSVTTYLPGRKLLGVRIGEGDEPVEVAVVLRADRPIPETVRSLRSAVSRLCGGAAVDITVADIAVPGEQP
jgi:hypothetical protein